MARPSTAPAFIMVWLAFTQHSLLSSKLHLSVKPYRALQNLIRSYENLIKPYKILMRTYKPASLALQETEKSVMRTLKAPYKAIIRPIRVLQYPGAS